MLQPAFQIINQELSEEDLSQSRLLIDVGPSYFSYVLFSMKKMTPSVVKSYAIEPSPGQNWLEALKIVIDHDENLAREYSETFLVYNFPESNLVPGKFFSLPINKQLTELVYGDLPRGLILNEKIPWWDIHNVYRIPVEVHEFLLQKFRTGKYWHYYSLLLKSFKMFNAKEMPEIIKVNFFSSSMVVMIFRNEQLQLIQTFPFTDSRDVSYHLLNCSRLLMLNLQDVMVQVAGLVDRQSAIYTELYKYFGEISFDELDDTFRFHDDTAAYPRHYFSSLLKMAVCV